MLNKIHANWTGREARKWGEENRAELLRKSEQRKRCGGGQTISSLLCGSTPFPVLRKPALPLGSMVSPAMPTFQLSYVERDSVPYI